MCPIQRLTTNGIEIAAHADSERSNVSRHLAVMLKAGALRCRKEGLTVHYSLRSPCVLDFLNCATQALKQNANEESKLLCKA